jgi:prepilin-type N-terminal cleavage/methylation domain-containing protein
MNRSGLTLLETLVALAILGMVGVAFLGLFTQTSRTANDLERWSAAVSYAESGMELAAVDPASATARSREDLAGGFGRTTTVEAWSFGTRLVTVTVQLPDGREFALRRLVAAGP